MCLIQLRSKPAVARLKVTNMKYLEDRKQSSVPALLGAAHWTVNELIICTHHIVYSEFPLVFSVI